MQHIHTHRHKHTHLALVFRLIQVSKAKEEQMVREAAHRVAEIKWLTIHIFNTAHGSSSFGHPALDLA